MAKWINVKEGLPRLKTVNNGLTDDDGTSLIYIFSDPVVCKYQDGYITTARFELFSNCDLADESYFMNDTGEGKHGYVVKWMPYEWINEA